MSTAAYKEWVKAGRPFELAYPVRDYRAQLRLAGWPGDALGTIGDEAHLTAETPQDHCPFSATGWPGAHIYPFVTALDVTHTPGAGRDVAPLVSFWLREARAGKTPWLKYITWRGQRFDVRNGWEPVYASGHYDHAHLSFTTNHTKTSIGGYTVMPEGASMSIQETVDAVWNEPLGQGPPDTPHATHMARTALGHTWATVDRLETLVKTLQQAVDALAARPPVSVDPEALGEALATSPVFVSSVADAVADRITALVTPVEIAHAFGRALLAAQES